MCDRFPKPTSEDIEPEHIADCEACGNGIYNPPGQDGYSYVRCKACNAEIHKHCAIECCYCGLRGCKYCLEISDEYGKYECEDKDCVING